MENLQSIVADVRKLKCDMYEGNGPRDPSITTRLALMEEAVGKLVSGQTWLLRMVGATLFTAFVGLIIALIKR